MHNAQCALFRKTHSCRRESDNNENGSMITKRRGRKPKDKFKYETNDNDEYGNIKTEENLIIKFYRII